jgi:hypothetical protein
MYQNHRNLTSCVNFHRALDMELVQTYNEPKKSFHRMVGGLF